MGLPDAYRRCFARGEFIVQAGDPREVVYLVQRGQVRVFLMDEEGRETTTAILAAGHLVGISPLLGRPEQHAFAQALTCVEAWAPPLQSFRARLPESQMLRGLLLGDLAQRFAIAQGLLRAVALLPVAERVEDIHARLTACLAGSPPALNRAMLAGVIHARPETLARLRAPRGRPADGVDRLAPEAAGIGSSAERRFWRGDQVLRVDPPPGRIGLILQGRLQLSLVAAGQRALVFDVVAPGDLVGVSALLGLPPVGLRAEALSDGAVQFFGCGDLLQRLSDQPRLAEQVARRLGARLDRLERRLVSVAAADARQRLIDLLRSESAHADGRVFDGAHVLPREWSHASLARQMGVCRETVTRTLAELARAGLIRRQGRRILVLDEDGRSAVPQPARVTAAIARAGRSEQSPGVSRPDARHPLRGGRRDLSHPSARVPRQPTHRFDRLGRNAARARSPCRLCGLRSGTSGPVCGGCAERLELELQLDARHACPTCGRHQELCRIMPCLARAGAPPARVERVSLAWLRLDQIDEPPAGQNSRRLYSEASIAQLAASIREHGLLQPLCVRPHGSRYQLVFGLRRLRAAALAGLTEVPCTIQVADDDRALLLNALENLHRQQLSGAERVRAIERLAATGLGVREISRRTGFNPSTISRWLRIDGRGELKAALEAGTLDIGRAAILVEAPRSALPELIGQASHLSLAELRARVTALKSMAQAAAAPGEADRRLHEALRSLRAVARADNPDLLVRIRRELDRLAHAG